MYRGRRFLTETAKDTKIYYALQAKKQRAKKLRGELEVEVTFYFKDKRKHDIDNCLKALFDSLTSILWEDDNQIVELLVHKIIGKEEMVEIEAREL